MNYYRVIASNTEKVWAEYAVMALNPTHARWRVAEAKLKPILSEPENVPFWVIEAGLLRIL